MSRSADALPMRVVRGTTIARPIEEVFALIADPHNDPDWCSRVRSVEQVSGDGPAVGARYRVMHQPVRVRRPMPLDVEILEREAPSRFRVLERDDDGTFDVTLTLESAGPVTRVTQVDEISLRLARPLHPIARRNVGRHLTEQLVALKALLEHAPNEKGPDPMSRIPMIAEGEGNAFVRYAYRASRKKLGRVPTPMAVTAHSPKLLAGYGAFETAVEKLDKAPKKLVALGEMRIAALVGCEFCIDIGTWLSRDEGITEAQIADLHRWRSSEHFDEIERLALTVADGMTATPCEVPADALAALRDRLGDQAVVEMVGVFALENYRARFNWTFDIGPDGFAEGMVCALPAKEAEAAEAAA